jgi:hypothetical protein
MKMKDGHLRRGSKTGLFILYVVGALLITIVVFMIDPVGADENIFTIEFDDEVLTSNSSYSYLHSIDFHGNITRQDGSSFVIVQVEAISPPNLSTVVTPGSMAFNSESSRQFRINVIVPPRTVMGLYDIDLTLTVPDNGTNRTETGQCHVWVNQFFEVDFNVTEDEFEVNRKGPIKGILNVKNEGNGLDSFDISIIDTEGIVIDHNLTNEVLVPAFSIRSIPFKIELDFDSEVSTSYALSFNITSKGSVQNETSPVESTEGMIFIYYYPSPSPVSIAMLIGIPSAFIIAVVIIFMYRSKQRNSH